MAIEKQVKELKGEYNLVSIKVTYKFTLKGTTWSAEGCFIRFGYSGRSGATPITYALTSDQVIDGYYFVPSESILLLMPKDPVLDYKKSTVGLTVSKQKYYSIISKSIGYNRLLCNS